MKKHNKKILQACLGLSLGLGLGLAFSSLAGTYSYQDQEIKINFKGDNIEVSLCKIKDDSVVLDLCTKNSEKTGDLIEKLTNLVVEADALLAADGGLVDKAKELASAKDAQIIKDEASGTSFVMLSITKGFNLPLDVKLIEKGDYSLVEKALTANKNRYVMALKYLESKDLPSDMKAKRYVEISEMMNLQNIVHFSKSL